MAEISSVSRLGRTEPFWLQISRGQISWHRAVTVFGYNPDIDTSEELVWPDGATISSSETAVTLKISSNNANDTSAGTGARTVLITGLDGSHNEVSETVTLNGTTEVNSANTYTHVNSMSILTVGSGGSNAGHVYAGTGTVTLGVPANIFNLIETGFNQSTTASYTIPAGYTGYKVNGGISSGQAGGSNCVTGKLVIVDPNGVTRVAAVNAMNNGFSQYDFTLPLQIPAMYTVQARAVGSSTNNIVAANFQILLVKNDGN